MRILNKKVWPYRVTIHTTVDEFADMRKWALECIQPSDWYPLSLATGKMDVYFKDEQNLTLFMLRWAHG